MGFSFRKFFEGIRIVPRTTSDADSKGDLEVIDSTGKLQYHNGLSLSPVVTEAHAATLTNKTISGSDNTFTNIPLSALPANTATTDTSQTFTNKTIDADANTITNIENADIKVGANIDRTKFTSGTAYRVLANNASGVMSENAALTTDHVIIADSNGQLTGEAQLAITRGGTGQSTANAGFNALAPTTTKGDLIAHNGSINVRVPVGTDTFALVADSSQASGLNWSAAIVTPSGMMSPYAGSSAPSGWLECDGSAISRVTFASLFAAIGTTWGVGDGSTTFNLPDTRGRALIGDGTGAGLSARTLGQSLGSETHSLSGSQLPNHTHTGASHTHTVDNHAHNQGSLYARITHTGTNLTWDQIGVPIWTVNTQLNPAVGFAVAGGITAQGTQVAGTTGNTSPGTSGPSASETGNPNGVGTGTAFNIMQPSAVIKWIIKT